MQGKSEEVFTCYEDLNDDGNSEKIEFHEFYSNRLGIVVFNQNKTIEQWNFKGIGANTLSPFISDFDNDGIREIIFFTVSDNDSLYIHCLDAINGKIEFENKTICSINRVAGGAYDFTVLPCSTYDDNQDGIREIYWAVRSGFTKQPRNMFAYDPVGDTVMTSPESCSLLLNPLMFDFDGDHSPEFFCGLTHATGNCSSDIDFTDQYTWLMLFKSDMTFKFPPVHFDKHPALSRFIPFFYGGKYGLLGIHVYQGMEDCPSFMALFDLNGNKIREKKIESPENWIYSPVFATDDAYRTICMISHDACIMQIDSLLRLHKVAKTRDIASVLEMQKKDLDCDGRKEYILPGKKQGEMIIYRSDFSDPVKLQLNEYVSSGQISVIEKQGEKPKLFVDSAGQLYYVSYETTFLYRYRYFLLVAIFLLFLFLLSVIRQIVQYRRLRTDNIQRQISELQVKSIQNQLDPHFTFNMFASFGNLINEKDTERANYIFDNYARLLKAQIINSEKIQISLREELDFVKSYLELMKFRYNNRFAFFIDIEKNLDVQVLIPKMIVHIFVENAVKHGLKHLNAGGTLNISAWKSNGSICIDIADNGIGRAKAKETGSHSTGKGMEILNKIIDYYYQLNNIKITYHITDLFHDNTPAGTGVKIQIPLKPQRIIHQTIPK